MTQGERSLFKSFILPFNNAEGLTADGVRGRRSQNQQSGPKVSADVLIPDPCSDLRSEQGSGIICSSETFKEQHDLGPPTRQ